jgi:uncharacterized protein YkwD
VGSSLTIRRPSADTWMSAMGIEDRDWYRNDARSGHERRLSDATFVVVLLAALLFVVGVREVTQRAQPAAEGERRPLIGDLKLSLLPGLPAVTVHRDSLYWPHDRWKDYLADEQTCPGGERTDLTLSAQANTMVCLVNYARRQRGLIPLLTVAQLNDSSLAKAARIVRCRQFAHAACGQDPEADARAGGYTGPFGENLYIADGRYGAPRVALDGWLNSPGHRENLFRPEWRTQGIAVQRIDRFGEYRDASLWVNQFGTG